MTDERPLNVRVAAALGCNVQERHSAGAYCTIQGELIGWRCGCPDRAHALREPFASEDSGLVEIEYSSTEFQPYGQDSPEGWACTGPLIQKFNIQLHAGDPDNITPGHVPTLPKRWFATSNFDEWGNQFPWDTEWEVAPFHARGCASACEAAAELICNAAEAGRLPK